MILVTGGTGFIGTHLLEKLVANREAVRALVRRTRVPRVLPAGVETVYGDLESGMGIAEALRGADAVIHLAGVTKALRTEDFYSGNVRATEQLVRAMAGQGIRLVHVSSLAAIGPSTAGALLAEDAAPQPAHALRQVEAGGRTRGTRPRARCRDRAPARGLRAARYGCLPAPEIHLQRSGARDRRRRALVQRDLRQGPRGRLAGRRPRAARGRDAHTSWRTPNQYRGASSEPPRPTSWRAPRAC